MANIKDLLQGIINSKNAIISAIKNKGVTVPANAKLSSLASLIEDVPPQDKTVYKDRDSITSIEIPSSVTHVGKYFLYNCTDLTNLVLNEGLNSIGAYAFYECNSLVNLNFPSTLWSFDSKAFYGCKSLLRLEFYPSKPSNITNSMFYNCLKIEEINLNNIQYISENAFRNCNSLKKLNINFCDYTYGNSIYPFAFYACNSLEEVTINKCNRIDSNAFYGIPSTCVITFGGTVSEASVLFIRATGFVSGMTINCSDGTFTVA